MIHYEHIKKHSTLVIRDFKSGHIYRFEIDHIKPEVFVFKNEALVRTLDYIRRPISEAWMAETIEDL